MAPLLSTPLLRAQSDRRLVALAADERRDQFRRGAGSGRRAVDVCDAAGGMQESDLGGELFLAAGEVEVDRTARGPALCDDVRQSGAEIAVFAK